MPQSDHGRRIEAWRRWQQRLTQAAILLAIAGAIALAWSLLAGPDGTAGGSTLTLSAQPTPRLSAGTTGKGAATSPSSAASPTTASSLGGTGGSGGTSSSDSAGSPGSTDSAGGTSGTSRSALPRVASQDDIPVYIVGAVARPGVYIVKRGSYLYELVDLAGGLKPEAAATAVNLAFQLSENQMVRIPTLAEASDPLNPNPFPTGVTATRTSTVNINTASLEELETLPGIGPATAAAIVADRKKNGPFTQPEDIMRVAGVKESRYEQLEPLISVH